ncbi:hypothetical protein QQS21_005700 [Conoideocrella luteorostrata]|uniref:N-acetyltransferase domain-containing protein n=1 Tax=Conoideocrella luteorostrata TaxID=1105319 RepID=A0AAJ0G0Q0_9HYPO|nr:hypothetical protein QQS21_005700 [Conoideocrella luteorostrata]
MLPTLSTQRLTLVPVSDEHLHFEIELDTNPEVQRYIMGKPSTHDEVLASHKRRVELTSSSQPPRGLWVGSVDNGSTPIGLWMLIPAHTADPEAEAELGYRLLPQYWKQGFASEGSSAVLEYAFATQGLKRMTGLSMRAHAATRATLTRLGFTYVGDVPTDTPLDHPEYEGLDALYELTAEQWAANRSTAKTDS